MDFVRAFSDTNINLMKSSGDSTNGAADVNTQTELTFSAYANHYLKLNARCNATLFVLLKSDVEAGLVFPAVRNDELHFYYKGGCLFKFVKGAFFRDANYENHSQETEGLSAYDKAKKQNENKFKKPNGDARERQLLDELYRYTFNSAHNSDVVVLDIEVNLKGDVAWGKKCDLVLLNTLTDEIMFVEGKVYDDDRVKRQLNAKKDPEVIEQVNLYSAAIADQADRIIAQYAEHVRIVNALFGTDFNAPKSLVQPAKLLVYETGTGKQVNVNWTIDKINSCLGAENVMWVEKSKKPTLDEIWQALTGVRCK